MLDKSQFNLFLKECEFRFNYGQAKQLLTTLKKWIKMTSNSPACEEIIYASPYIFIVDADNTAHKRYVELGEEQSDGTRVVVKGLQKGERYIVNGAAKARDGKKVLDKSQHETR